jgi:hypothetical protein
MLTLISAPYSASDPSYKAERVRRVAIVVNRLMKEHQINSFSPTLYGLAIIEKSNENLPDTYDFWKTFCVDCVSSVSQVYVLNMEGWKNSGGVKDEIEVAKSLGIPVFLIDEISLQIIEQL